MKKPKNAKVALKPVSAWPERTRYGEWGDSKHFKGEVMDEGRIWYLEIDDEIHLKNLKMNSKKSTSKSDIGNLDPEKEKKTK